MEDGVAFCPQCRAPQIRVVTVESPPGEAAVGQLPQGGSGVLPPLHRQLPATVSWSHALPAAAVGGVLGFLAMFIPFGALGPAYAIGGALAILMYRTRTHVLPSPKAGARIGAASGGFAFLIFAIIFLATYVYDPETLRKMFTQAITQWSARGYDPQGVQQVTEMLNSPGGLGTLTTYLLVACLVIFLVGFSAGGALCAAYLRRRRP